MKKLLILGGVGDMGSYIVKDAVKFGEEIWSKITIADINEKKAKKLLSELNNSKLAFRKSLMLFVLLSALSTSLAPK